MESSTVSPAAAAAVQAKAFALKFISGKYQGGEFPLKPEKQIIIGRSSELDMVLVEDMVSRKHAKIQFSDGKVTIEDLGSTNGTFVNGEKITQARLKEGDRILIGTSILKLVQQAGSTLNLDENQVKKNLEAAAAATASRRTSSMTGKIEEVPLPDLLQLFHTSKKNGVLVVKGESEAKIYLRQGRIYYACIDDNHDLGPQKSFNRIITWEQGDFELRASEPQEFMVELDSSTEALLMDGLRQYDELKRSIGHLPPNTTQVSPVQPLPLPLRNLTADELDVFQLAYNFHSLRGVLDHGDKEDPITADIIVSLVKKGYLQAS